MSLVSGRQSSNSCGRLSDSDVRIPADGVTGWFVRRAGLARCTTMTAVTGLILAALLPGRYLLAVVGLTLALGGILTGHVLSRVGRYSGRALAIVLASVVLVGLFGGLLAGSLRIANLLQGALSSRIGQAVEARVVVTGPVSVNGDWQSATAVVRAVGREGGTASPEGDGAGENVLLEVAPTAEGPGSGGPSYDASPVELVQGGIYDVRGDIRAPEGPSASGYDQAAQLLHQGIRVVLQVEGSADLSYRGQRGGVAGWFDRLRASAKVHLSRGPDPRINEVLQGVVMGDTVGIDKGWMDAFRRSGTAHMLSVSGLHVASLAAIMIALAGFARLSRRAGFVLAAGAALLMIPFVGPSPPIVRSAAMIVVVLAARWVGRGRDPWQGLAFAAVVVLAINPFAVFDVGFQLSFCAFVGMLALAGPLERLLDRAPEIVRADLAVSLAATLGTAPISLVVFHRTSLIAPVANLLVVPTLGAITGLGMASIVLGFVWSGFSVALDTLASLPMSWTVLMSSLCAQAPVLEAADVGQALFAVAAGAVAVPGALALAGRTVSPPLGLPLPLFRRTLAWLRAHRPTHRRRGTGLAFACVLAALVVGAVAYPAVAAGLRSVQLLAGGRAWPAQLEVRTLDVGQGTAVLVRTPQHHAALFDGGPAGCELSAQLRALGVRRLDLVVVSHPHADHFAGLLEALDSLEVGVFVDRTAVVDPVSGVEIPWTAAVPPPVLSGTSREAGQYLELRARLAASGCRHMPASTGSSLVIDGVDVRFFSPERPLVLANGTRPWGEGMGPPSGDELNAGSLVALLTVGKARVLLPGDAEAEALRAYELPAADVLVVPHHGSRGAVSTTLLAALRTRVAVISVGKENTFGHPDRSTLALLAAAHCAIVRTDAGGWVSLLLNDAAMTISSERTRAP
jgi:competence protein ComEC